MRGAASPGSAPAFDARSEWVLWIRVALAHAFACTERRHGIQRGRNGGSGSGRRNGLATRGGAAERGLPERQAALQPSTRDLSGSYRSALLSRTLLHVPRDATSFAAASKAETHPDECGVNGFAEVAGRARRCCSSCVLLLDVCHAGTSWLLRARVCCCCTLGLLYLLAAFISCGLCIAVCIFCNAAPAPAPLPPQGGVCTDAVHFCSAPPAAALTCWAIFAI